MNFANLDFRNIASSALRNFWAWFVAVLFVAFIGNQPGVVCVTPLAWLMALRVGNFAVTQSHSAGSATHKLEAALAGGLLGFMQGILFAVIIAQVEPINANELARATTLTIGMIVVGIFVGALLSFITAYFNEQRRNRMTS